MVVLWDKRELLTNSCSMHDSLQYFHHSQHCPLASLMTRSRTTPNHLETISTKCPMRGSMPQMLWDRLPEGGLVGRWPMVHFPNRTYQLISTHSFASSRLVWASWWSSTAMVTSDPTEGTACKCSTSGGERLF